MNRLVVSGFVLMGLMSAPAISAEITDQETCWSETETMRQLDANTDVDPKFEVIVKELIGVLEHLCETKAFSEAEDVAGSIRGILTTGEPVDGPKKT